MKKFALLCLFVLASGWANAQCMSGVYTIGGVAPNYPTFTAAVAALTANGVCGPVSFDVRDGTYNEQFSIPAIVGTSAVNTIHFHPEILNSPNVLVQFPSSAATPNNFVVQFSGCNYVTFLGIRFTRTGSNANCRVVSMINSAAYNKVLYCPLTTLVGNNTPESYAVVWTDTSNIHHNEFEGNTITGGSFGIRLAGPTVNHASGNVVELNTFVNQAAYYLYTNHQNGIQVIGNTTSQSMSFAGLQGFGLFDCSGAILIERNRAYMAGTVLFLFNCSGTALVPMQISNNFLKSQTGIALYLYSCQYIDVLNNSISMQSSVTGTGMETDFGGNIRVINNCVQNGQRTLDFNPGSAVTVCDYNNLWTQNSSALGWSGVYYANLAAWRAATGRDMNSIAVVPNYVAPLSNLHINGNIGMESAGTFLATVPNDVDNQVRNNPPDIGADEFNSPADDVQMLGTTVAFPICLGVNPITARVRNIGTAPLTSVTFCWKINNVTQPPFTYTGNIPSGDTSAYITIGSYNFTGSVLYNIKIWCYLPNNQTDPTPQVDTVSLTNGLTRMSGTYTIGGLSPNYASFTTAINALNLRGICGPVTFNVADGTYAEKITLQEVDGASYVNRITFQGANQDSSLVTLQFGASISSTQNYVVNIDGGDYFTFRKMTIRRVDISSPTAYYTMVIDMRNAAVGNIFENCRLWGSLKNSGSYPNGGMSIIYSSNVTTLKNDSNIVRNNLILNGTTGLAIARSTSVSIAPELGWRVYGNYFSGQSEAGVSAANQSDIDISGNRIITTRDTMTGATFYGILMNRCYNGARAAYNTITHLSGWGIYVAGSPATALVPGRVYNNMISNKEIGLYVSGTQNYNFYHNSINVWGPVATSYCLHQITSSGIRMWNNIFCNSTGGKIFTTTPATVLNSNHNDFYTTGIFSNSYGTFAQWQLTGHDLNSVFIQPPFLSWTDLHIPYSDTLNNRGDSLGIADDHEHMLRNDTTPDMGAHEFDSLGRYDIGVLRFVNPDGVNCHGLPEVNVRVKNFSPIASDTVRQFRLYTRINNVMIDSLTWTGVLLPGDSVQVQAVASYYFLYGQTYTLECWTKYPNNILDTIPGNDTLSLNTSNISMGGVYTIGGINPDFPTFNKAKQALVALGVCDSVIFNVRHGLFSEQLEIPAIQGAGPQTSITFRSEIGDSTDACLSWVTTATIFDWVLYLNGADYIRFEHLMIGPYTNPISEYAPIIILRNGATHNRFSNNTLLGRNNYSSTPSPQWTTFQLRGDGNHYVTIENNRFVNGIYLITCDSVTTGSYVRNVVIRNNDAYNPHVCMFSMYQCDTLIIDGNRQMSTSPLGVTMIGINNCIGNIEITRNQLYYHYSGIGVSHCYGTAADPILIANNMYSSDTYSAGNLSAINIDSANYVDIIHNSVAMEPPGSYTSNNLYAGITLRRGSNIRVMNNSIANYGNRVCIFVARANIVTACDYNNYYSPYGRIANVPNGNTWTTPQDSLHLNQWQALTGFDLNSTTVDPHFRYRNPNYTGALPDVHLDPYNIQPLVSNVPWPTVTGDVDGDVRSVAQPTKGADEYFPIVNDATVSTLDPDVNICTGVDTVKTTFRNIGTAPLTSLLITWSANNVPQTPYNWTGSLGFGDSITVVLGTFNFVAGANTVQIVSQLPNNSADMHPQGDTLRQIINATVPPVPNLGPDIQLCSTGTVNINGGVFLNWLWSTGSQTYNEILGPGTHWLRVSNNPGCYATDTIVISVVPGTQPTFTGTTTICNGSSTSITASGANTYVWMPGNLTTPTVVLSPTVTTTYTVTGTSINGCTATSSLVITVVNAPNVTVGGTPAICDGGSATLTATGASTYNWMPGNLNGSSVVVTPTATTTYTVVGTTAAGCTSTRTITVTVNPLPTVVASGPAQICTGSSAALSAGGAATYNWMPGNINGANINVTPSASTTYTVTGTSAGGCSSTDTIFIALLALPSVQAGTDVQTCPGVPVTLNGSGGISCVWSPTVALTSSTVYQPNANPVSTTDYVITVTDANGCQSRDTVRVIVYPLAPFAVCCDQTICPGDTLALSASPFYSNIVWTPSAGLLPDTGDAVLAFPAVTTTYVAETVDINGCAVSDSVTVTLHPAVPVPVITLNGIDLVSSLPSGNQWYLGGNIIPGATGQIYTPIQNGVYTVEYTDANGCRSLSAPYNFISTGSSEPGLAEVTCYYSAATSVLVFNNIPAGEHSVLIYDATGRFLVNHVMITGGGHAELPFNGAAGVYFVSIGNVVQRIIVGD